MFRLLRIEALKVLPYRVFQILGILYVVSFVISIIVLPQIKLETDLTNNQDILDLPSLYKFPIIWDTYAYLAAKSNIFLAIIVIFLVGNEYSYLTFRQHVVGGLSRNDLLNGKLLIIFGIALANMLIIFICGWIFGFIYSADYTFLDTISHLPSLGIYLLQAVSYMLLALMLTVWLRNKTLSIVILLLWSIILEPILRLVLNKYVWAKFGLFFPVRVISRLSPFPDNGFISFIKANAEVEGFAESLPLWSNIVLAAGYGLIFYLISQRILAKRDL